MGYVLVGIDLGTTGYSVVVYSSDGSLKPLADSDALYRTPCYVAFFPDTNELVGLRAKQRENENQNFVIYEPKRLIGRSFNEMKVQVLIPYLRYFVINDGNGQVEIISGQENYRFKETPYRTYKLIFENIKHIIKQYVPNSSTIKVVITVPSMFTEHQRQVTSSSATQVGFTVLGFLGETTAIATSYIFKYKDLNKDEYFLVYDLGASNFKIGLFQCTGNNFIMTSIDENTRLSGEDFNIVILDYVCKELHTLYDVGGFNKEITRHILLESEKARIALSYTTDSTIALKNIPVFNQITLELSRTKFEEIANHLFEQTVSIVNQFIDDAKIDRELIGKIILYGGLAETPKIQQLLFEHFGDKISNALVFENSSVAEGAAIHAAVLQI